MSEEMEKEYTNLLALFKKLGVEEYYDETGYRDKRLVHVRNQIKAIEKRLTSKEIIDYAYKAAEKKKNKETSAEGEQ